MSEEHRKVTLPRSVLGSLINAAGDTSNEMGALHESMQKDGVKVDPDRARLLDEYNDAIREALMVYHGKVAVNGRVVNAPPKPHLTSQGIYARLRIITGKADLSERLSVLKDHDLKQGSESEVEWLACDDLAKYLAGLQG